MKPNYKLLIGIAPLSFLACNQVEKAPRPNIVLILADDMGYSDLGCFGSQVNTPNLDRLAHEGVRMTQFYNNARSCPSRAALLTGLYPHQAGVGGMTDTDIPVPEYQGYLNEHCMTLGELLKESGYSTYLSGKWHVGEEKESWPHARGFEKCFSSIKGAGSYFDFLPYRNEKWPPGNDLIVVNDDKQIEPPDTQFYVTDVYTDYALEYLQGHDPEKPFFLYLGYTAPHWPLHALPEDIAKYEGKYQMGWDSLRMQRYHNLIEMGLIHPATKLSERNEKVQAWDSLSDEEQEHQERMMTVYAAMIDRMDQNIGRIIEQLEFSGQLDNTLIIFLSDNGGCRAGNLAYSSYSHERFDPEALPGTPESFTGYGAGWANASNTPYRLYKSQTHEGGIATPFIAYYPRKFGKNKIIQSPAHIVDILPTFAELAGTSYPETYNGNQLKPLQGKSLVPLLTENKSMEKRTMFFEHMDNKAVINGHWKLVKRKGQDWELYDLETDRGETNNLVGKKPGLANDLKEKYNAWAKENKVLPWDEVQERIPYKF
jgi:arylsulfatase